MSGKVKVWGNVVTVEWADPIEDPDPEVMAKVMWLIKDLTCLLLNIQSFVRFYICNRTYYYSVYGTYGKSVKFWHLNVKHWNLVQIIS